MKQQYKYKKLLIFIWIIALTAGCKFGDKNIDPNGIPTDKLLVQDLLQGIELNFADLLASDVPRSVSNTMGQIQYRQGDIIFNSYIYSPNSSSIRGMWSDIYSGILFNSKNATDRAKAQNANHYKGILNIIRVVSIAHATAIWGDVPFSQIFNVEEFPNPAFDSQESIYNSLQQLLDESITDLSSPGNNPLPGTNDKIFGGNASKWIKTAYGLKARYYLHLAKQSNAYYSLAESALQNALLDSTDNCIYKYEGGVVNLSHPLYQERIGTQNTNIDSTFVKMLQDLNDPRLDFFAYTNFDLFTGQNIIGYGPFYTQANSYIPIITLEECLFMKAEISLQKDNKSDAEKFLRTAIKASLDRICSKSINPNQTGGAIAKDNQTMQSYADIQGEIDTITVSNDQAWQILFTQKYISQFLSLEVWNDYRRSSKYLTGVQGLPNISPREGSQIPRRYPYSFDEISYNSNTPSEQGIFARVWWDVP